jgi:pyridoxamine 5'-phosphate oxidase
MEDMGDEPNWEHADPIGLFHQWLREAQGSEPNDPNAAALATATAHGRPSVRMVLVKRVDERGFCFFTNGESRKGRQLAENPRAALCFHWKTLRRQVRVEGSVSELCDAEVDEYFHSRSRRSQIGAAVSDQSRPLQSRENLAEQVRKFADEHPGEVPRPSHWHGYCVAPEEVEFWIDGPDRLHDRILFTPAEGGWEKTRLYP